MTTSRFRLAPSWGHWLFWLAAGGAIALTVLAPLARARGWWIAEPLYEVFHRLCHQQSERSFQLDGHPLAVCHRCAGIYLGFWLGLAAWPWSRRWRPWLLANPRWVLLGFVPVLIDFLLLSLNTPLSRVSTGLVAGLPLALLAGAGLAEMLARPATRWETSHVH